MLRYTPVIGAVFPTLAWWFIAWDVSAPWSDMYSRAWWLYLTATSFSLGVAVKGLARA